MTFAPCPSAKTKVFNADAFVLNETTVTDNYDKTVDMTDPMDKWGNVGAGAYNSDAERTWITKEFNLYAKWRSTIEGANGIGVVYSSVDTDYDPPVTSSQTASDNRSYVDKAAAVAASAVTAPSGYQFEYWIMQTYVEAEDKYVDVDGSKIYPGQTYEVLLANAKISDVVYKEGTQEIKSAKYTIQLRAKYKESENPTPTFIPWYRNDGTTAFYEDTRIPSWNIIDSNSPVIFHSSIAEALSFVTINLSPMGDKWVIK